MADDDKRQFGGKVSGAGGVVLVYATFPAGDTAASIGAALVEERLAACVNILPGMTSIYRWEGAISRDAETVMIIKTTSALAEAVIAAVRARHPYTNPALLVLPAGGGSPDFLAWIAAEVRK